MHIFGDEGGYTGNQLLDDQDVFTYATVAIDPSEAEELAKRIARDYRLQGSELKGRNLVKRPGHHKVVTEILRRLEGRFQLAVHHKAFALCCKFFEYVFEPTVSESNSFFYQTNLHLFVGTVLYKHLRDKHADAEQLLDTFSIYARKGSMESFHDVLPAVTNQMPAEVLQKIGRFASIHRETISNELGRSEGGEPNWLLDLTRTTVYHQLTRWSERFGELIVTCDDSAPLRLVKPLFDRMVGRNEQVYVTFHGEQHPFLFNLKEPLQLVNSKVSSGVQLADVVASCAASSFSKLNRKQMGEPEREWMPLLVPGMKQTIWPEPARFARNRKEGIIGAYLLEELVRRSITGSHLYEGLPHALFLMMFERRLAQHKRRKR